MSSFWHVYIAKCSDGTYYTGISTDVEKRIAKHNSGKGAAYTKHKCPVRLVYSESHANRSQASKREYAIKQLSRKQKQELIENYSIS